MNFELHVLDSVYWCSVVLNPAIYSLPTCEMALSTNQVAQLSSAVAAAVTQAFSQQHAGAGAGTGANNGRSECTTSSGGVAINTTTISTCNSNSNNRLVHVYRVRWSIIL